MMLHPGSVSEELPDLLLLHEQGISLSKSLLNTEARVALWQ